MDQIMKLSIFASLLLSIPALSAPAVTTVTTIQTVTASARAATSQTSHESGGDEHIVIVNKDAPITPQVAEVLQRLELHENHPDVRHVFNNSAFQGFAASMKSHCLDLLANMSDVSTVEKAVTISRGSITSPDSRPNAPWGLQRISTASSVHGNAQAMDYTYSYSDTALGDGADIYILDTGIYTDHNVFSGRASMLWSFDNNMQDLDGHGTHVSGTAAGDILGVASNAKLYGIKTLDADGGGWSSNVVAGIDYVIQRHDARKRSGDNFAGSVISMSLASSGPVTSINQAVEAAISAGIHTCVAAGNAGTDACSSSPASSGGTHGGAITVGAVDINASPASFSNYGECVDLYAPGVDVVSSWIGGKNMVNSLSGTSMATPHVTGIIAYAMANRTLAGSPGLMKEWVRMVALPQGDGVLLANNGISAPGGLGLVRRREGGGVRVEFEMSKTKVSVAGVRHEERSGSGRESSTRCTRSGGSWLCNAKRSLAHLAGLLNE
ncbi:Subtilisin-like protease 2 [Fulvia fulva]|uniref:Subtilisin-like protease 2 n=1 Tax=Passalora fulva TaxID=5499 RepID=A0A9Q8L5G1_PASFU|nr:Subtilisin-like protease 2 [Fulvia fulva]KAK4634734.1 Subtilisin-like protease 2 [Fulvia fulva]KAK4637669.1 Subtilisin-like protease 2 [Fulvia fulva]UJO11197.1 Subtilisin-like protease 2 [Fulvia fulva]WPV08090.1 Subtilisin-like protease 2 [Fulvia fulva]WPV24346.1 Subtilisin-like protease 2 [Fulvia fulva]